MKAHNTIIRPPTPSTAYETTNHASWMPFNRVTLEQLYEAFIQSKLEYAAISWDNCSQELDNLLEGVHYRAATIISGAIHRLSHELVYKELGWECLRKSRRKLQLKNMYRMVSFEASSYQRWETIVNCVVKPIFIT